MRSVAYYAMLDNVIPGAALRLADGTVHFQAEATGLWTQLYDGDIPRLQLNGRVDIADAQMLADGDRVYRMSTTVQAA